MAIAIAVLGTPNATDTDGQTQARTIVPVDNSVVIVHAVGRDSAIPGSPSISDNTGGTWTAGAVSLTVAGGNRQRWWYRIINGTSPGSTNVTVDWGSTILSRAMGMISITGCHLTTPIVAGSSVQGTGTGTTAATATAPALSDANNAQIILLGTRLLGGTSSAEAGWDAEVYDITGGAEANQAAAYYKIGAGGDTSPTATLSGSVLWMIDAFEVSVPSSAIVVGTSTRLRSARRRR